MLFSSERQKIIDILGFFWSRVFLDSDFVDKLATAVAVQFQGLNDYVAELPDYLSRALIPIDRVGCSRIFVFNENDLDRDAAKYGDGRRTYGGGLTYGQQSAALTEWRYPIAAGLTPKFLTVNLVDPAAIMQIDVHYTVADGVITFKTDPLKSAGLQKYPTVHEGQVKFGFVLWGFAVHEDIQAINNFFGVVAGIAGDTSSMLKEAMNIAWDLRTEGASVRNIARMLCYITRTDYVDKAGQVVDIYTESDRLCVLTDNSVYTAPLGSSVVDGMHIGSNIQIGDIIFDTFVLKAGQELLDFEDFEGLTLGPGYVGGIAPNGLFFPNIEVAVSQERHPDFFDFVDGP